LEANDGGGTTALSLPSVKTLLLLRSFYKVPNIEEKGPVNSPNPDLATSLIQPGAPAMFPISLPAPPAHAATSSPVRAVGLSRSSRRSW